MGLALLCIIWLITFVSTYFFAAKTWWLPKGVAAAAPSIDHQFAFTYVLMGINARRGGGHRSEEHTSELQSLRQLVCRLRLQQKKTRAQRSARRCRCTSTR